MSVTRTTVHRLVSAVRRSLRQFLALPLATVLGFIALNALVYVADERWSRGLTDEGASSLGLWLGDNAALGSLLATVATSIITVTSITFSLLLIAVQQAAGALTTQVTDQFMARRTNQLYFGYFVGLSVFALLTLITNTSFHRPLLATVAVLLMTTYALCLVIVMIYSTIDQMRPERIVQMIHESVLAARAEDLAFLARTRRSPRTDWIAARPLRSPERGYVVSFDLGCYRSRLDDHLHRNVEVAFCAPIGAYRAGGDPLFEVRLRPGFLLDEDGRAAVEDALLAATGFDDGRDLRRHAAYGLHQLSTIAWTSASTAKSNPAPAISVLQALRDIIGRWSGETVDAADEERANVVYADLAPSMAIDAVEAIIVVASESIQAQTLAEAMDTLTNLLGHADASTCARLADVARRSLSTLGEHVLTTRLEASLHGLTRALAGRGFTEVSASVAKATNDLAGSLGELNSRSTRVPGTTA